jgi:hypothetical protein
MKMDRNKQFTITKRIAKHGKQIVIIIPSFLREHLKPGILAEIRIAIINS